ncbi:MULTISPECIES: TRP75-related protein [Wolbachia]|uniref:TRP75-related protein n=1 Tax=Wolbachia TaxID=953 RepID=UPI001BA8B828|nr:MULTISPECIES: TRP75-related protein [unclassified Wolbachia]QUI60388.1 TRP75-related protein [Wolbachia endosymbiont of Spodoptera picta]URG40471.1 TRP75-related protein [Wolbachia endosymbiont of Ostrinia furnacalis]URG41494.1 TRP75-related protein [Wolbachia endosymbiont of Ostrinia scapulalis]
MFKFFSKILFILIFGFFAIHNAEAKSKVKLSKRYIPPGNPGGANFHVDEDFAESYKLYEKRRALLKKKKLQGQINANINKEDLIKKLKEKKIASLDNEPNNVGACIVEDEEDAMINQHGINLARLKGAVFIDQEPVSQYESKQHKSEQQKGKNVTSTREKKVSPINVTIKESPSRRTCSHDSITDLNRTPQHSLNGSSSFGSVVDTVK